MQIQSQNKSVVCLFFFLCFCVCLDFFALVIFIFWQENGVRAVEFLCMSMSPCMSLQLLAYSVVDSGKRTGCM